MVGTRETKRADRRRHRIPSVAIAGYTNAGKSSLLNRLTGSGVLVEDSLFATLDPTTRRTTTSDGRIYTMSDTVGFVRHLPHQLVDAFRSTLEEIADSDLILHVVDGSHPDPEGQIVAVREVLTEIGADKVPELMVINKADEADPMVLARLRQRERHSVVVSAKTGEGIEEALAVVESELPRPDVDFHVLLPYERGDLINRLHQQGEIDSMEHTADGTVVRGRANEDLAAELAAYAVEPRPERPPSQFGKSPDRARSRPQTLRVVLGIGATRLRMPLVATLVAVALVAALILRLSDRASGDADARCDTLAALSAERASVVVGSGTGRKIAVIGDSYAFGTGLDVPADSWPSQLSGRVRVDGFPGSGFSATASSCPKASYADRARAAAKGADLVVVEGGLNDVDRRGLKVRAGFKRLMRALAGHQVVVVGPANAPARAAGVPRINALLAELSAEAGVRYLRMSHLDLPYLGDQLHLTAEGHRLFGESVASRISSRDLG